MEAVKSAALSIKKKGHAPGKRDSANSMSPCRRGVPSRCMKTPPARSLANFVAMILRKVVMPYPAGIARPELLFNFHHWQFAPTDFALFPDLGQEIAIAIAVKHHLGTRLDTIRLSCVRD